MLHIDHPIVKRELLNGSFGLELESLRITDNGVLSGTAHPFPGNEHVDRDFSENQTEFNTEVFPDAKTAVEALQGYYTKAQKVLAGLPDPECFWPFSNPPVIHGEEDIPIARYHGEKAQKTAYREYLSDRYGRYKMTFSGIHVNFSFSDALIQAEAEAAGVDIRTLKDRLYLDLAERAMDYGWLLTAVTAASPVMDYSFHEKGATGDCFGGLASVRCSELGYWNFFTPILSYENLPAYISSIQRYMDIGLLRQFSELYYPIRLKPKCEYSLQNLVEHGINHIELRMFDLNPLVYGEIDVRDVEFAQLMLVWLASGPDRRLSEDAQVQAVQNFKSAAHYDLKTVRIIMSTGESVSAQEAAIRTINQMKVFYRHADAGVQDILEFQIQKFKNPETAYARQVRKLYGKDYFARGLELALARRAEALTRE